MRFLDSNVFIYAYYKPKRQLNQKEMRMKDHAKKIITDLSHGKEDVATTIVHLSEVANILKHGMSPEQLTHLILGLFMLDNVRIYGVTMEAYFAAVELGGDLKLDPNDALAVDIMRQNDIREIYSFDEDFDKIEEITRLPKL
ncbi:MAG: type II toxin-antitoxin system VapC family toxin [Candidatus Bathyarchaeia archaeon]